MSIRDVLNEPDEPVNGPQAIDYEWHEIWGGGKAIREYYNAREVVDWVAVCGTHLMKETGVLGYGDHFNGIVDAVQFTDGTYLACCSIEAWGGTFRSSGDNVVKYFYLTPKNKTAIRKAKRKK